MINFDWSNLSCNQTVVVLALSKWWAVKQFPWAIKNQVARVYIGRCLNQTQKGLENSDITHCDITHRKFGFESRTDPNEVNNLSMFWAINVCEKKLPLSVRNEWGAGCMSTNTFGNCIRWAGWDFGHDKKQLILNFQSFKIAFRY